MELDTHKYVADYQSSVDVFYLGKFPRERGMVGLSGLFLYSLVRTIGAQRVLETGTANGTSAVIIADAVQKNGGGVLLTVDIDPGTDISSLLAATGKDKMVKCVQSDSVSFMESIQGDVFDLIFLDGSHERDVVAQELTLAVQLLRSGGVVAMDDVYRNCEQIGAFPVVEGPWMAIEKCGLQEVIVFPDSNEAFAYFVKG